MRATVAGGSAAVGQSLADLALETETETETGVDVTAIRRRSEWLIAPGGDVVL
jgi:uncharacterized protein with PhoU and TrkA domain